jgi:hypothetical protein
MAIFIREISESLTLRTSLVMNLSFYGFINVIMSKKGVKLERYLSEGNNPDHLFRGKGGRVSSAKLQIK